MAAATSDAGGAMPSPKVALRASLRAARAAVPAADRAAAALTVAALAEPLLASLPRGAVVGLYAGRAPELDTAPLATATLARGLRLAYPRVAAGERALRFHLATPPELAPGAFGLAEPRADAPAIAATDLAVVFVPGVGFDADGGRLGSGHGYYDVTFRGLARPLRVGLALPCQLVARVPQGAHDVPVHHVLSPAGPVPTWPA